MKKIIGSFVCMLLAISTVSVTAEFIGTYNTPTLSQPTAEINITIQDFFFSPDNVTIAVDTIVTWTNLGPMEHSATSDNGVFNSGLLEVGQKFSFTFTEAGTYRYHCAPHPFMHGIIIVTGGANLPPNKPTLTGQNSGSAGVAYNYTAMAVDPENMTISYFFDWGDNQNSGWTPFVTSSTAVTASHKWSTKGSYTITVKAKDEHGGIGPTATLTVSMPYTYQAMSPLLKILERFPHAFPHLIGLSMQTLPGDPGAFTASLDRIVRGLKSPTLLTNANDQSHRLFIGEQIGKIHIYKNGTLLKTPFLDLRVKIIKLSKVYDERGLLGLVFHPDYKNNGRFFVYYTAPSSDPNLNCDSVLAEYKVSSNDPNKADPASEKILLRIGEPEMNHNGGQLAFGPDGYLYIGVGDGGGAGDQHGIIGNGQNKSVLLGKILRIDVNNGTPYGIPSDNPFVGQDGRDEIYAYGFRNPFRFSFDTTTGRLFVADVGQDLWEELDLVINGGNYGWRIMEGNHPYDLALATTLNISLDSLEYPIFEYSHDVGHSIIGGYVYHGSTSPGVQGSYVFGDWSTDFLKPGGKLYYLTENATGGWHRYEFNLKNQKSLHRFILGIGEDESGELYLLTSWATGTIFASGEVWRIHME